MRLALEPERERRFGHTHGVSIDRSPATRARVLARGSSAHSRSSLVSTRSQNSTLNSKFCSLGAGGSSLGALFPSEMGAAAEEAAGIPARYFFSVVSGTRFGLFESSTDSRKVTLLSKTLSIVQSPRPSQPFSNTNCEF